MAAIFASDRFQAAIGENDFRPMNPRVTEAETLNGPRDSPGPWPPVVARSLDHATTGGSAFRFCPPWE